MEPIDDPQADLSLANRAVGPAGDALEAPRKNDARKAVPVFKKTFSTFNYK